MTTIESRLKQAQAIAGSLFAIFVLLHLSNIFLAPFGSDTFNEYQRHIRQFYQFPLVELVIVILPIIVHAIAGVWLWLIRRAASKVDTRPLRARLHSWTGVFLLLFIIGHILAVRGSSYFYGVYAEFEGLAFSLWYMPAYFYPYYFLLALAGFYHATNGLRTLAARRGSLLPAKIHTGVIIIAAAWILVSLLSLGGVLVDVENPADNDFARLAGEITGMNPNEPWK